LLDILGFSLKNLSEWMDDREIIHPTGSHSIASNLLHSAPLAGHLQELFLVSLAFPPAFPFS
jgi:hypothetical protein